LERTASPGTESTAVPLLERYIANVSTEFGADVYRRQMLSLIDFSQACWIAEIGDAAQTQLEMRFEDELRSRIAGGEYPQLSAAALRAEAKFLVDRFRQAHHGYVYSPWWPEHPASGLQDSSPEAYDWVLECLSDDNPSDRPGEMEASEPPLEDICRISLKGHLEAELELRFEAAIKNRRAEKGEAPLDAASLREAAREYVREMGVLLVLAPLDEDEPSHRELTKALRRRIEDVFASMVKAKPEKRGFGPCAETLHGIFDAEIEKMFKELSEN
jgi:hypothetical protein